VKILPRTAAVLTALAALVCPGAPAGAAGGIPREGKQYVRLHHPQPVHDPAVREVLEFFWYDCHHSQELERPLQRWASRQPADVLLRRVPAVRRGDRVMAGQARLYYTLERLGLVKRLQRAVFRAVHDEHRSLASEAAATSWAARHGISSTRFRKAYESAQVRRHTAEAPALLDRYRIPEFPSVVVQGRYRTGPTPAGGVDRVMPVVDYLVRRSPVGHHRFGVKS
jgi:thiol:disulfide interchange protein DsbA